jgi:serine/threonine protein kinase
MHQIFEDASFVYLIMDLQKGRSLNKLITENQTYLQEETALVILEQIFLTLDYMH